MNRFQHIDSTDRQPVFLDDFEFIQDNFAEVVNGLAGASGATEDVLWISGSKPTYAFASGGNLQMTITPGYILLSGKIYRVDAQVAEVASGEKFAWQVQQVTVSGSKGVRTLQNGGTHDFWEYYRAKVVTYDSSTTPPADYYSIDDTDIKSFADALQEPMAALLEPITDAWITVDVDDLNPSQTTLGSRIQYKKIGKTLHVDGNIMATMPTSTNVFSFNIPGVISIPEHHYAPTVTFGPDSQPFITYAQIASNRVHIRNETTIDFTQGNNNFMFQFTIPLP